jgi:hypothetical protein
MTDRTVESSIRIAAASVPLLLGPKQWIHRRVHSVTLVDETRLEHRISLDFTVPEEDLDQLSAGGDQVVVPLAFVRKGPMRHFDLRDESGAALPTLTVNQNHPIALQTMELLGKVALTEAGIRAAPDPLVLRDVVAVALDNPPRSVSALQRVLRGVGSAGDRHQREKMSGSPKLRAIATDLCSQFVLYVVVRAKPGERRIVKFRYEDALAPRRAGGLWRRMLTALTEWLGFTGTQLTIPVTGMGTATSFHFEIEMPAGAIVERAALLSSATPGETIATDTTTVRAHLMAHDQRRGMIGAADLRIRARPPLLLVSWVVSLVTAALLWGGWFLQTNNVRPSAEPATALLVALPGLYLAYIVGAPAHRLVQRLSGGLRQRMILSTFCSLLAAGTLTFEPPASWPGHLRVEAWLGLAIVAVAIALLSTLPLVMALRVERRRQAKYRMER